MKKILLASGVLLVVLGVVFILHKYLINPAPPEIAEKDYLILGNEPPFHMKPLPEDQVETTVDQESAEQVVEVKEGGFSLRLSPNVRVVTREVEPGTVYIYRGDDCRVVVSKEDWEGAKNIEEWEKIEKKDQENSFGSDLIRMSIKKMEDFKSFDAYLYEIESEPFGLETSIYFQSNGALYAISKSNKTRECLSIREVLDSIRF